MEANVQITHVLLGDLIASLPQAEQVLQRFQQTIETLTLCAPKHIDPEYLVELRARTAVTVSSVRLTLIVSKDLP